MTTMWIVLYTDTVTELIGKEFLGLSTDLNHAKGLAQSEAAERFTESHIGEIDGIWCIEGRVDGDEQVSYIGVYPLVKKD
jgi:hypothetical protein